MKKRSIFTAAVIAALICLTGWTSSVRAQGMSNWEAQVRVKLAAAALLVLMLDAHQAYSPYLGKLNDKDSDELRVTLNKGAKYSLLGVCDNNCRLLDMELDDDDGEPVAQNQERNDAPHIEIIPAQTERYRLNIFMKRCDHEPCYYGLGVYTK